MTVELLFKTPPVKDDLFFLRQILQATAEAEEFLAEGARDRKTLMALRKEIEIIAETAMSLPGYLTTRYPDVPWRKITGLGGRLAAEFSSTDGDVVWEIAGHDLPKLRKQVSAILKAEENHRKG